MPRAGLGLVFTLCLSLPAAAGWEYTDWGMSVEEVIGASAGKAVRHREPLRESWGVYPDLIVPYRAWGQWFEARCYFSATGLGLGTVRLVPQGRYWCIDILRGLMTAYGPVGRLENGRTYWRDPARRNLISLSDFGRCQIRIEPAEAKRR